MSDGLVERRVNGRRRWGIALAVVVLLAGHWVLAVTSARTECTTFDELAHLTAGYTYWAFNDYRINPENGNLPARWAMLPVMLGDYHFPSRDQEVWRISDWTEVGAQFFYRVGNNLDRMLLTARAMMAVMSVGLCALIYFWSRSLFGRTGGLISLIVAAFSPAFLAHGRLVTSDIPAALFFTASMGALWRLLQKVSLIRALVSVLVMGGLFLSKMSAVLFVPMGLALVAVRLWHGSPLPVRLGGWTWAVGRRGQIALFAALALLHALAVWLMIWGSFAFRYSAFVDRPVQPGQPKQADRFYESWEELYEGTGVVGATVQAMRDARALPEAYLYGFMHAYKHAQSRYAFINWRWSDTGWWYFFPYCFLVKTPLPLFGILALALAGMLAGGQRETPGLLYRTAPLWVLIAIYWAFAINSRLNIGERHIMVTYPAMFILTGACANWFALRRWAARLAVVGLLAGFVACSLSIWPHYLAYFNYIAGGPANAYQHLVDSSLDWGQDLPALRRWLDGQGLTREDATPVYLYYFGRGSPTYYGIRGVRLPRRVDLSRGVPADFAPGIYCISATNFVRAYPFPRGEWNEQIEAVYQHMRTAFDELSRELTDPAKRLAFLTDKDREMWQGMYYDYDDIRMARLCAYLRSRRPDYQLGYSILVFRLSQDDLDQALRGPPPLGR